MIITKSDLKTALLSDSKYYKSDYYIHSVYQGEPFTMMVIQSTKERNRYSINLNIAIPKEYESIVK